MLFRQHKILLLFKGKKVIAEIAKLCCTDSVYHNLPPTMELQTVYHHRNGFAREKCNFLQKNRPDKDICRGEKDYSVIVKF